MTSRKLLVIFLKCLVALIALVPLALFIGLTWRSHYVLQNARVSDYTSQIVRVMSSAENFCRQQGRFPDKAELEGLYKQGDARSLAIEPVWSDEAGLLPELIGGPLSSRSYALRVTEMGSQENPFLMSQNAASIDRKIDDALPTSGKVRLAGSEYCAVKSDQGGYAYQSEEGGDCAFLYLVPACHAPDQGGTHK